MAQVTEQYNIGIFAWRYYTIYITYSWNKIVLMTNIDLSSISSATK